MKTVSITHSAISIVSALAMGKGGAIGIDIPCKAEAKLVYGNPKLSRASDKIIVKSLAEDRKRLVKTCVNSLLRTFHLELPKNSVMVLSIKSSIPPAVGLKSSSAVSLGVVEASAKMLGLDLDYMSKLVISSGSSKKCGVSVTGAFDDASACLLGGIVLTDNQKNQILKHTRVPLSLGKYVVIRIPLGEKKYTSSIDPKVYSKYKIDSRKAFDYAMDGEISQAMILNSIIQCSALHFSFDPISSALSEGASACGVSGKGPAMAAICTTNKIANKVERRWREAGHSIQIIRSKIVQPRRIVHT